MGQPIIPERKKWDLACDVHRIIQEYHKETEEGRDGYDHSVGTTGVSKPHADENGQNVRHGARGGTERGAVRADVDLNVHPNVPQGYTPAVNPEPSRGLPICEDEESLDEELLRLAGVEYHLEQALTAELAQDTQTSEVKVPNLGDQGVNTQIPCTNHDAASSYPTPEPSLQPYPPINRHQARESGVGFNDGTQETPQQPPHFPTVEVLKLRHGAITALRETASTTSSPIHRTSTPESKENTPNPEPLIFPEAWMSDKITLHALEAYYRLHPISRDVRPPMDLPTARAALIAMKRAVGLDMETWVSIVVNYADDNVTPEEEAILGQFKTAREDENPMFPVFSFVLDGEGNFVISERACWLVIVVMEIREILKKNIGEGHQGEKGGCMDGDVQMVDVEGIALLEKDPLLLEYEEYIRALVEEVLIRMRVSTSEMAAMRERVSGMVIGVFGL